MVESGEHYPNRSLFRYGTHLAIFAKDFLMPSIRFVIIQIWIVLMQIIIVEIFHQCFYPKSEIIRVKRFSCIAFLSRSISFCSIIGSNTF